MTSHGVVALACVRVAGEDSVSSHGSLIPEMICRSEERSSTDYLYTKPTITNTFQAQLTADTIDKELSIDQLSDLNGAAVWGIVGTAPGQATGLID